MAIRWTSADKHGDPVPWPYKPFCNYCSKNTEFVINPELGFKKALTYCAYHFPKNHSINDRLSININKEIENDIKKVRDKHIKEFDLLNKIYDGDY